VSWRITSIDEFASTIPVNPPNVKRTINPSAHSIGAEKFGLDPLILLSHEKTLTPVGTAITIVADVKYARVSTSIPTTNIWCPHTMKPKSAIESIA